MKIKKNESKVFQNTLPILLGNQSDDVMYSFTLLGSLVSKLKEILEKPAKNHISKTSRE